MTVPALLLVLAAAADTLSPSTTTETAATEANLIPVICSPHGRCRPGAVTSYRRGADLSVDIHLRDIRVKRPRCAAAARVRGPSCRGRAGHQPDLAARRARTLLSWTSAIVNSPTARTAVVGRRPIGRGTV